MSDGRIPARLFELLMEKRAPTKDTLDALEREIGARLRDSMRGPADHREISYNSRGRRYTFYWHQKARRLRVSKHSPRPAYKVRPGIEALAERLRAVLFCVECGREFPRNRRQRYCSPAHGARYRKRAWKARQAEQRAEAEAAALIARLDGELKRKAESSRRRVRRSRLRSRERHIVRARSGENG